MQESRLNIVAVVVVKFVGQLRRTAGQPEVNKKIKATTKEAKIRVKQGQIIAASYTFGDYAIEVSEATDKTLNVLKVPNVVLKDSYGKRCVAKGSSGSSQNLI